MKQKDQAKIRNEEARKDADKSTLKFPLRHESGLRAKNIREVSSKC